MRAPFAPLTLAEDRMLEPLLPVANSLQACSVSLHHQRLSAAKSSTRCTWAAADTHLLRRRMAPHLCQLPLGEPFGCESAAMRLLPPLRSCTSQHCCLWGLDVCTSVLSWTVSWLQRPEQFVERDSFCSESQAQAGAVYVSVTLHACLQMKAACEICQYMRPVQAAGTSQAPLSQSQIHGCA